MPNPTRCLPLSLLCLSLSGPLWPTPALAEAEHPLDKALSACIEADPSTLGMHACNDRFRQKWDAELNRYYALLGGDKNTELRRAQVAWIAFRDAEFKRIEAHYRLIYERSGGGTMWGLLANASKTELVRQRALELKSDYDLLRCGASDDCPEAEPSKWGS